MVVRLVAGIGGLLFLIPLLLFGGEVAVEIVVPAVMLVCATEFVGMAFPGDRNVALGWVSMGIGALYGTLAYAPEAFSVAMVLYTVATLIFVMLRPGETLQGGADAVGRYLLGPIWIGVLLGTLTLIRRMDGGLAYVFVVLAISWAGDTGAYFAGRSFGRTKLYERVSPKKTWEGVAGGVAAAIGAMFVIRAVALSGLLVAECIGLGAVLCLAGVAGDLSESLMKRAFDVKDSGWIMPGHGGLLDRIDSVLFVAPLLFSYLYLVRG